MADTPDTQPAKRTRKSAAAPKADMNGTTTPAIAAPLKDEAAVEKATDKISAKIAPIREQADKLAKAATDKINAIDWKAHVDPLKEQAQAAAKAASDKIKDVDWKAHVEPLKEQAGKTAMSAAVVAKDKTGSAMQGLAKLISETAGTVDAKLGPQYGDYARKAAEQVAGAADSLDSKDVDQLMADARDFVRKSPAVAIGAAAVVGYVLMRMASGSDDKA